MALINANWNPSERQLTQFGWAAPVFLTLAGWASLDFRLPVDWSPVEARIVGALMLTGLSFAVIGVVKPGILRPLFIALSLVTLPIGVVVGELTLLCIYFGVFFPIGLMFRIMGRDALARRSSRDGATRWTPKSSPTSVERYFHQY